MDEKVKAVLDEYHARIERERGGTADLDEQLLAVGPQTGRFLNILARSLTAPTILEIGTSFGYSGIWLAEAARATGGRLITMELQPHKSEHARTMAARAGLADVIDFRVGDAVEMIAALSETVDLVLMDLWKDLYVPCLEAVLPRLRPGAIIVADNMISPGGPNVEAYGAAVRGVPGMTSVLLPIGSGLEVSRLGIGSTGGLATAGELG